MSPLLAMERIAPRAVVIDAAKPHAPRVAPELIAALSLVVDREWNVSTDGPRQRRRASTLHTARPRA